MTRILLFDQDIDNVRRNRLTLASYTKGCGNTAKFNACIVSKIYAKDSPVIEPVDASEVKEYSHIDNGATDYDNKIKILLRGVRNEIQGKTGLMLIPVEVTARVTNYLGNINLYGGNVSNVKDDNGNMVDLSKSFGSQMLTYDAGIDKTDFPDGLKMLILEMVDYRLNGNYGIPENLKKELYKYHVE